MELWVQKDWVNNCVHRCEPSDYSNWIHEIEYNTWMGPWESRLEHVFILVQWGHYYKELGTSRAWHNGAVEHRCVYKRNWSNGWWAHSRGFANTPPPTQCRIFFSRTMNKTLSKKQVHVDIIQFDSFQRPKPPTSGIQCRNFFKGHQILVVGYESNTAQIARAQI